MVRRRVSEVLNFATEVLTRVGLNADDAEAVAMALVDAEAGSRGTHGLANLGRYARAVQSGEISASPRMVVTDPTSSTCVLDADNSLGIVAGLRALQLAVARARTQGMAGVAVRNSNHFGAAGYFARLAAEEGFILFCTTNGPSVMSRPGGREAQISNNPFAWGLPTAGRPSFVLDIACSVVSRSRIREAARRGEEIPEDWAVDSSGEVTSDSKSALDGCLLPMSGHKGFGLAVVNDLLAAGLSNGRFSTEVSTKALGGASETGPGFSTGSWRCSHFFLAIDPGAFGPDNAFVRRSSEWLDDLAGRLPGEQSAQHRAEAADDGIALSPFVEDDFRSLASELEIGNWV